MANSSPNQHSYRAAVRALNQVAVEEASKLCAVIDNPEATEPERLEAIQALGSLVERLVKRMSNLERAVLLQPEDLDERSGSRKAA